VETSYEGEVTILWLQQMQTDRTISNNKPGIIIHYFSRASDSSMSPGVDSASKNEYQDIPGGKDGRCVKVMTLPPSCAECLEIPQRPLGL